MTRTMTYMIVTTWFMSTLWYAYRLVC